MLEFSRPIWLVLLLGLPLIWWLALKLSYASLGPWQKWISLGIRTVVWLLLVFSLAGAQFVRKSDRVSVMVVRDSSDSVTEATELAALAELEEARKTMTKDDSLGKINFGSDAYLEFLPLNGINDDQLADWQTDPRGNFTDIGEAIQLATASFPDNAQKRLVLLTDGNENIGNALSEAQVARDHEVEVIVVPLPSERGPEVVLASLDTPSRANIGETVKVRFVLDSTVTTQADVSLIRNGEFVDKTTIQVRPGKEVYEFPAVIDQSGFFTYELMVEPVEGSDTIFENNRAYAFTVVSGKPRLLYATGDPNEINFLPATLTEHTMAVDVVPPGGIPYALNDFMVYDGIIFSDISALSITEDQMKMVQTLVRDFGKGFMMIGGENSFGPGGYFKTPIEETLPVDMDFRRKKITASSLVVCLIDKSGSMATTVAGTQKIDMAKEACKAVVELQQENDFVGVMGFDGLGQWVVQPVKGIDKETTLATIGSMQAGGGTDLYPALEAAWKEAKDIPVQVKHFIVFTDGIVAPNDFEGLMRELERDNITVSTVAFGTDADIPFLQNLADIGGGNMYSANSLRDLPKIFTREVFLAHKATFSEEPFFAQPTGDDPLTSSVAWSDAPMLLGYVATSAKDEAQVQLMVPEKGDPLLATWRYGLGKSAAFTSDAKNRWANKWLGWWGYERFWSGVARWIKTDLDSSGIDVTTSITGNEGLIRVSAVGESGKFVNYASLEAIVTDPGINTQKVALNQTGPGQYEGRFRINDNGNYFINVVESLTDEEGVTSTGGSEVSGLSVSYSPEYRELEPNSFLLSQLQTTSIAPEGLTLASLFTEQRHPKRRLESAWELFVLIALCLWLLDVATRRVTIDPRELSAALGGVLAGSGGRRASVTSQALGGLLEAKSRVQHRRPTGTPAEAQARREELGAQAQARERASGQRLEMPQGNPAAQISTPEKTPAGQGSQTASSISNLRSRMDKRSTQRPSITAAPTKPPVYSDAKDDKDRNKGRKEKTDNLTGRQVTSRLLDIKRKKDR